MNPDVNGARPRAPGRWSRAGDVLTVGLLISAVVLAGTIAYLAYPAPSPPPISTIMIRMEYSPEEGNAPLTVSFHANVTGGEAPYSYFWSFGDGTNSTSGPGVDHLYSSPGFFGVTLTVTCLGGRLRTVARPGLVVVN